LLILDTHVWVWLVAGDVTLAPEARDAIEQAAADGAVLVPAIAVWEVAMLESRGCLVLGKPVLQWVEDALLAPGLDLAPFSPDVAVESVRLPSPFHADSADRMIVATARIAGATLVTRDRQILDYGAHGHVAVLPA
jgi:PIN domain nuclease of toxin-antitoxin system